MTSEDGESLNYVWYLSNITHFSFAGIRYLEGGGEIGTGFFRLIDRVKVSKKSSLLPDYASLLEGYEIIHFASSDSQIMKVATNGTITPKSWGFAYVEIQTNDGFAAIEVQVTD